jgi:hypothetical protein
MADDVSLSTVTADPTLDTSDDSTSDGGASEISSLIPAIGQWGSVITSIATGHPLQGQQTPQGGTQILGAKGSSLAAAPLNTKLLTYAVIALVALVIVLLVLRK